jgi:hypothetical protein
LWANISTYAKLALLSVLVFQDPMWTNIAPEAHNLATTVGSHLPQGSPNDLLKLAGQAQDGAAPASAIRPGTPPPPLTRPASNAQANIPTEPGGVYVPQGTYVPQGLNAPQMPYATQRSAAGYAPPSYGPQGHAPQGYAPQGYGPGGPVYGQPGGAPPHYRPAMPGYPNPMGVGPMTSPPRY